MASLTVKLRAKEIIMQFNKLIRTSAMIAVLGLTPVSGALAENADASFDAVQQETVELMRELKAYGAEQRDEAVDAIDSALDSLDAKITALEARVDNEWDAMGADARKSTKESMAKLRAQRAEMAEWFGNLKSSTDDTWDEVKDDVSDAYQDLSDTFSDAWADAKEAVQSQS